MFSISKPLFDTIHREEHGLTTLLQQLQQLHFLRSLRHATQKKFHALGQTVSLKTMQDANFPIWLPRLAVHGGPRFLQIADALQAAVIDGSLTPGERLSGQPYFHPTARHTRPTPRVASTTRPPQLCRTKTWSRSPPSNASTCGSKPWRARVANTRTDHGICPSGPARAELGRRPVKNWH